MVLLTTTVNKIQQDFSPFTSCYGGQPDTPSSHALPSPGYVPAADTFVAELQGTMRAAKQAVHVAQARRATAAAYRHRRADAKSAIGSAGQSEHQPGIFTCFASLVPDSIAFPLVLIATLSPLIPWTCQGMSWQHLHQPCVAGKV